MIGVELSAAIDTAGSIKKFYISNGQLVTLPTDTPANTAFEPALLDFTLNSSVFANGNTTGSSSTVRGEIVIANVDGQFDDWLNYSFDGRAVTVRFGNGSYPSNFNVLYNGIVEFINVGFSNVVITLRDLQALFDKSVLSNFYGGTNALPNGIDGNADLKGKPKPKTLGVVFNIAPVLVNSAKLVQQVSDTPVFSIVAKDKGVMLVNKGDVATSAQLLALNFADGYYTCLAEGLFRLGASPSGKVTADVVQGSDAAHRTVASLVATLAGLAGASLDQASFTALAAVNQDIVGIYISGEDTYTEVMDSLVASIGAYYIFNSSANLTIGLFGDPSNFNINAYFADYDIQSNINRKSARDNNVPIFAANVNYNKNYSKFGNDLAGSVGAAQSALLSVDYLTERAADNNVSLQYKNADELAIDSLLSVQSAAATYAAKLLAIYKVRRDIFEVSVNFDSLPRNGLALMNIIQLTYARLGLDQGRKFNLLSVTYELKSRRATLSLWG